MSLYYWMAAHTAQQRVRRCSRCGHRQVVPRRLDQDRVKCTRCQGPLDPVRKPPVGRP